MNEPLDFEGLLKDALRCGVSVLEFWDLTPRETYMAIEAALWRDRRRQKQDLSLAWHTAALTRVKRMPSLKSLLTSQTKARRLKGEELRKRRREFREMSGSAAGLVERLNEGLRRD